MENAILFVATVFVYLGIWVGGKWFFAIGKKPTSWFSYTLKRAAIIAILVVPFNINGTIYTVAGNAINNEGSIVSIASVYQKAKNTAFTFFAPFSVQEAGNDAVTIFGISLYQKAVNDALTGFSVSFYQEAGNNAVTIFGISLYQEVENDAVTGFGVSFYQEAENDAITGFGVSFYQKARNNAKTYIGVSLYQEAGDSVLTLLGVSLYQEARNNAVIGAGVSLYQEAKNYVGFLVFSLYQKAGEEERYFGLGWLGEQIKKSTTEKTPDPNPDKKADESNTGTL